MIDDNDEIPPPEPGIVVTHEVAQIVNVMKACKTISPGEDWTKYTTQDALWALINLPDISPEFRKQIEDWSGHKVLKDKDGLLHCDDGPALVTREGFEGWYQHGVRHRIGGPAVTNVDGTVEYWENGKQLDDPNSNDKVSP